jgi:adenylosuccinate lyase
MKNIWEEENKYKTWLKIELLACEAQSIPVISIKD